jgi:hypothetical protein
MPAVYKQSRTRPFRAGLAGGLAILAIASSACTATRPSAAASQPTAVTTVASSTDAVTQTNEGGQVTIAVAWDRGQSAPVFNVAMNTHSVDLDAVDLSQVAVLRTDHGAEVRPTGWDAPKGGHHRSGTLTFPTTTPSGAVVLGDGTGSFELLIRNVAGVPEREFRWAV